MSLTIGFVGAGNMAQSLASGFIQTGKVAAENVSCSSPSGGEAFRNNISNLINATTDNAIVYQNSKVVILAVKPQYLSLAIQQCHINNNINPLIVSIVAGINLKQLSKILPENSRVVRVMTNTPIMVRQGISVFASNELVTADENQLITDLLSSVGLCTQVPENLMNSYGGLFGSGPAYVFMIIEALADGAVKMGVPRVMAQKFATQLLLGSSQLLLQTGKHPGELKDMVCSPGGTTIAGVYELEKAGLRAALMSAVEASTQKSYELSKQFD